MPLKELCHSLGRESIEINFARDMFWPSPPPNPQLKKSRLFSPIFFYKYTNRTGMLWNGQFWFFLNWLWYTSPTLLFKIIFNMICTPFISMVVLTTKTGWPENLHYRKMVLTNKNDSGHAVYFKLPFHLKLIICEETNDFQCFPTDKNTHRKTACLLLFRF